MIRQFCHPVNGYGMTAKKGGTKLTVDQNGKATFSGTAGIITSNGSPVLDKIGAKIKRVSVSFNNKGDSATYPNSSLILYTTLHLQ